MELSRLTRLLGLILVIASIASVPVEAGVQDWVTPSLVIDASPHIWARMANVLIDRLYDPSLGLFKETWGTSEGQCWYWNTEQGEASQIIVYLNNETLLSTVLDSYKKYLSYDDNGRIYLFSRYTPCKTIRTLSTDPKDFSLGNLLVNIGGDLAGERMDNGNYTRIIALSLDVYKDYSNIYEQDKAWPNLWYTANLRAPEVWYLLPNATSDYMGIWDTSNGSLGTGRIISYSINVGSVGNATRVMSDGNLTYTQEYILEPGKPYVKVLLKVRNNSTLNMTGVRVSLAFDNMDWWLYQMVYLPGIGYINASTSGSVDPTGTQKEYHFAYSWEGKWEKLTDDQGYSWWPSIIYANRPLGMNRALAVLVNASYGVHFWGYGNYQAPQKDLYGVPAYTDWYYRWLKYEVQIGDLEPNESRTVEVRIIPMASYAPGMEDVVMDMLSRLDQFEGRDFSYAINTGTGAFKGLAMSSILLGYLRMGDYEYAENTVNTVGSVMEAWHWRVSTRALSNYIIALLYQYDYTRNMTYLQEAESAADTLLGNQVKDASDPRNGGFLDITYPFGVATYLDVNAEAVHALLELYQRTGNTTYSGAVDYLLDNWFHKDSSGQWYYYRYRSLQDSPGEEWYKGYLYDKQPYAQGYFLQALYKYKWSDPRLLVSASKIYDLLSDELWELTWEGANETNVETQSSTAAGLRDYLWVQIRNLGAGVEYVRGADLGGLDYAEYGSYVNESTGMRTTIATLTISLEKPPYSLSTLALYMPSGAPIKVLLDGAPASPVSSLQELYMTPESFYWDNTGKLLYIRLQDSSQAEVYYQWMSGMENNVFTPVIPNYNPEQPPKLGIPGQPIPAPGFLDTHKNLVAGAAVGLVLLLATETMAPYFALVAAGIAAAFTAAGWLSIPEGGLAIAFTAAGLGVIVTRKRS